MPAVRLLGRRTGARATGGPESASTQPRGSERQADAGVAWGWGRRDSGEPTTGALPAVRHARTRARGRERREGAAAPRQPHGCSGEGREREQQEGQEVHRRSREGRSGKKMPVLLGAGDAETAVSQPQGRRREDARTKRRSGSALPAVRLLGRRTGARATGGSGSSSMQPRGSER